MCQGVAHSLFFTNKLWEVKKYENYVKTFIAVVVCH